MALMIDMALNFFPWIKCCKAVKLPYKGDTRLGRPKKSITISNIFTVKAVVEKDGPM